MFLRVYYFVLAIFLEDLNNLLEVRMRFSKLPLRIRLRWSSAGRVLTSDSRCKDNAYPQGGRITTRKRKKFSKNEKTPYQKRENPILEQKKRLPFGSLWLLFTT